MTYTFKLARRLAVSRRLAVLTALALIAACTGDATGPQADQSNALDRPSAMNVSPRLVTIETNQQVQFRARMRNLRGDYVTMPLDWASSGGAISTQGVFSSQLAGSFKIVGRGRGWKDSSTVTVVSPASDVVRLAVSPDSATLNAGATKTFSVTGYKSDGTTATVGVNWSATGGTVDPAGAYTAGSVGGTYRVIATNTAGTLADTAVVKITLTASPTLASVVLSPLSVSLTSGTTRQFKAYGLTWGGDSVAVSVAFAATGGTITSGGLYTAGQSAGSYRVIANASGVADTAPVAVTSNLAVTSVPYGASFSWATATTLEPGTSLLNGSLGGVTAATVVDRITAARSLKHHLMLNMIGGSHSANEDGSGPLLSIIKGVLQFDPAKWGAKLQTYNTASIRQALANGIADGTVIGVSVMDEPNVSGSGDANTWGPPGTMTKLRVDSLCGAVKALFPTLPTGVNHRHDVFEPTKSYRVCDFIGSMYATRVGDVTAFRDGGLAMAARDHHAIWFGLNVLDGGTQDKDGTWDCAGTGGLGTYSPNCRMTAAQLEAAGKVLGPAGCYFNMWRYNDQFFADLGNQSAFKTIASLLASTTTRPCRRTS
jgi:hypothetical protein